MKRGRPKKVVEVVDDEDVTKVKRGRGRPKKMVDAELIMQVDDIVKKKRGRPRKDIGQKIVDNPVSNLVNDKVVVIDCTKDRDGVTFKNHSSGTHSFCPDCGIELTNIGIHDADLDENHDTYGCPRCNIEVTKDNEVTLHITNDGMKLDYNSLTITKFDE